jgi:hypothetical protein
MKLLITGVPGMGKTTIGNYFQSHLGYEHLDAEEIPRNSLEEFVSNLYIFAYKPGENKVITWGFQPGSAHDQIVQDLQCLGYRMVWFDGNREAAHRAYLARGDAEYPFQAQMARINAANLNIFDAVVVDPFDKEGNHLPEETIIAEIFKRCS